MIDRDRLDEISVKVADEMMDAGSGIGSWLEDRGVDTDEATAFMLEAAGATEAIVGQWVLPWFMLGIATAEAMQAEADDA